MNDKQNRNRLTDTENKLVVTSEKEGWGGVRQGKGIKRYKLLGIKQIRYKDIMHSTRNVASSL